MAISPRALLRYGKMYANGGMWNGTQVIPAWWPSLAWTPFARDGFRGFSYGLSWWIADFDGVRAYISWGHGGQFLFIAPDLDLIVVMTSSLTNRPAGLEHYTDDLFALWSEGVIPAVIE